MNGFEMWQMIVGSGGILGIAVGVIFLVFRTGRIVQKIDTLDKDIAELKTDMRGLKIDVGELRTDVREMKVDIVELKSDLKEVKKDVIEINDRVSFMEGFIFFSEFKTESHASRSDTMKEVWKKRRMKQVSVKDK